MAAPTENYAFTIMLSPDESQSDGIAVVDVNPKSKTYGEIVHQVIVPHKGDEFHRSAHKILWVHAAERTLLSTQQKPNMLR